jgi:hypothetical protein
MNPTDLGLDDVDVRAASRQYNDDIVDRLAEKNQLGAVLLAPRTYSLRDDPKFMLLGFQVVDTSQRYGVSLRPKAILTLVYPERNEVWASLAIRRNEQATDEVAEPTPYKATSVNQFTADLRERLPSVEWRPGRYLATVHILDQCTNRAAFDVSLGPEYDKDPAVAEFLARKRVVPLPRVVHPSSIASPGERPVASYRANDKTPPAPASGPGLTIAVDERVVVDPAPAWVLRGSYRLVPAPSEVVPTGAALAAAQKDGWAGVGDPEAVAVIGVTLVLVGSLVGTPYVVRVEVPSYDRAGLSSPERMVVGQFALDLRALPGMPRRPQTYTMWAFSGAVMAGPTTFSVVTQEMLAR